MSSLRYVDTEKARPRWRMTANVMVVPTLQLGVEVNPAADEVGPLATWFVSTEEEWRPAAFLGTSSDRIGSPAGKQAYFLTVAKHVAPLRASPYVSLNYSEWDAGWNVPFGMNVDLGAGLSMRPMYDGERTHLLGSYAAESFSVTLIWVWLEKFGAAVAVGF